MPRPPELDGTWFRVRRQDSFAHSPQVLADCESDTVVARALSRWADTEMFERGRELPKALGGFLEHVGTRVAANFVCVTRSRGDLHVRDPFAR